MSLRVTSLASGSSGNALLVQYGADALLVDCGVSQRMIERQLRGAGLAPGDLRGVLLTHEHGDHTHCAGPLARRYGLPVVASSPTLATLGDGLAGVATRDMPVGGFLECGPFVVQSFPVPHDAAAPVGYLIRAGRWCVGVAVDLGSWDEPVAVALREADLVVVEANHDYERLKSAPYAWPVKQRIYSPLGHLDNVEAGRLLAQVAADGRRRTAWLAHLSQEANSPQIALRVVSGVLSLAAVRCVSVQALPRRAPHSWESDRHMEQLELFAQEFDPATR
jgi:phosphoribosyl 1,2-cyclic phosphodiesterase